jgi:predicted ATPase
MRFRVNRRDEGLRLVDNALARYRATGANRLLSFYSTFAAVLNRRCGHLEIALNLLRDAVTVTERTEDRWYQSEVHRELGETLRLRGSHAFPEAEVHFTRALDIAVAQQALLWELRAATSLARLWRDRSKSGQAHDLLAPVYGRFTEGFDTPDLENAEALLDDLRE